MKNKIVILLTILFVIALSGNGLNNYKNVEAKKTMRNLDNGISIENSNEEFSIENFFEFDPYTKLSSEELPLDQFASKDLSIQTTGEEAKILIFHSHSQESYIDSKPNDLSTTVVGVGRELKKQLEENYGISVLHCEEEFDVVDGKLNRRKSFDRSEVAIKNILKENPFIEVLIDIHRDGVVPGYQNGVIMIKDKPTAKILLLNGISKKIVDGKIIDLEDLPNPYIEENLYFSFQIKLKADEIYPDFMKKIYIKSYRYSLHMAPKTLLIDVGNNENTFEEAMNSVEPLVEILADVLGIK